MASSSSSASPAPAAGETSSLPHADLANFLERVAEYESTMPEEVCRYYMQTGGVKIENDQDLILKLVALATDHFIAGIVHDASEFSKIRERDTSNSCLRASDVTLALERRGVTMLHAQRPDEKSSKGSKKRPRPQDSSEEQPLAKKTVGQEASRRQETGS